MEKRVIWALLDRSEGANDNWNVQQAKLYSKPTLTRNLHRLVFIALILDGISTVKTIEAWPPKGCPKCLQSNQSLVWGVNGVTGKYRLTNQSGWIPCRQTAFGASVCVVVVHWHRCQNSCVRVRATTSTMTMDSKTVVISSGDVRTIPNAGFPSSFGTHSCMAKTTAERLVNR